MTPPRWLSAASRSSAGCGSCRLYLHGRGSFLPGAAAHSLARHERLLGISGLAAQNLLESFGGSIEKAVNRVLAMLGENLEADRAYIWLFLTEPVGSGNLFAAQMYEWSRNPEFRQEGEQGAHVHAASALPNC